MAIQKIEIIDNNKIGDCELLAVHNPLVYTIKMSLDDSGDPYDDIIEVDVNISGNETEFIGTFNAPFLKTLNPNERIYIFNADEILRSGLNPIEDYEQDFNDKADIYDYVIDTYLVKGFFLTFKANTTGTPIEVVETLTAVNASKDFEDENGANMVDTCNDVSKIYVGAEGEEAYTYDYNGEVKFFSMEIPNNIIDGSQVYYRAPSSSVTTISRGFLIDNPISGLTIFLSFTMRNTPILDREIQIGANNKESHDNIIQYLKDNYNNSFSSYRIALSPEGHAVDKDYSVYFEDLTGWYGQGFWTLLIEHSNYSDGNELYFDYTTLDGLTTTEVRMVAKNIPTLSTDFQLDIDPDILKSNIDACLIANYPNLSNIVGVGNNFGSPHSMVFQSPEIGLGISTVFVELGYLMTVYDGFDTPNAEINSTMNRKKILLDQSLPFEVNMRNVNHVIWPKKFCENSIKIKYIDRNGEYRYHVGESKFKKRTNQKQIGSISRLVTSLKNDLGDEINVGFRNFNTIVVKLNDLRNDRSHTMIDTTVVTLDEIALLQDFYNSPDVQIYISNKWISVIVSGDRAINKSKGNSISPTVTLELPKSYNITQL
jgi:hypothetical protein